MLNIIGINGVRSKRLKMIGHGIKRPQKKINTFWGRTIFMKRRTG
jgi:hypothetical protein